MKRYLFYIIFIFTVSGAFAQTPVTVCDQSLKIGAMGEETFYYGFAEGDQIVFDFEEVNGKELKEIEIVELPSSSKYSAFKTAKVTDKKIYVNQKGVYSFRFKNGAAAGRICNVKIQRIPESPATQKFNTGWKWKTVYDTTYSHYTEDSLVGYKTIYYQETVKELAKDPIYINKKIADETPIIHSKTSAEGQYSDFNINIPKNITNTYRTEKVIDCYIILGLGDAAIKQLASVVSDVTKAIASVPGPQQAYTATAAATAKAVATISSTKDDDIKYTIYKINNGGSSIIKPQASFTSAAEWHFPSGYLQGNYKIVFYNDNIFDALKIKYTCYAIVEVKEFKDVTYDREKQEPQFVKVNKTKMSVSSHQVRTTIE